MSEDLVPSADMPALIDSAAFALANARNAAEVLQAKEMAGFAYDQAKRAGRVARAQSAHSELMRGVRQAQGDAAEIEFSADARLAEEYTAAQERGEAAKAGQYERANVPEQNVSPASAADLGISRKTIHSGRIILAAETAEPGIVRRTISDVIERGEEPTKAVLGRAVAEAAGRRVQTPPTPKPAAGEAFTRFLDLAADMGTLSPQEIADGIPHASRRAELMTHVRSLLTMLERVDELVEGSA